MKNPFEIAVLFLHPACNIRCRFCATENGFSSMRPEQAVGLLDRLKEEGIGKVIFGGGEPLSWVGGIWELCRQARKRGFTVQVGTNGILLPEHFERLNCVDRFILPLEAADPRVHDRLRFYENGHHGLVLQRLERLREAGKEVTLSTVVSRVNADALGRLAEWIGGYVAGGGRVHAWHLYQFIPWGRGGRTAAAELELEPAEYRRAAEGARRLLPGVRVYLRPDMRHSKCVDFFWFEGETLRRGSEAWREGPEGRGEDRRPEAAWEGIVSSILPPVPTAF